MKQRIRSSRDCTCTLRTTFAGPALRCDLMRAGWVCSEGCLDVVVISLVRMRMCCECAANVLLIDKGSDRYCTVNVVGKGVVGGEVR